MAEIWDKWEHRGERTLIFFYYAGHGQMFNVTYALLNDADARRPRFPLESLLRNLGTSPGAFVIGVFDCCRENFVEASRGLGPFDN